MLHCRVTELSPSHHIAFRRFITTPLSCAIHIISRYAVDATLEWLITLRWADTPCHTPLFSLCHTPSSSLFSLTTLLLEPHTSLLAARRHVIAEGFRHATHTPPPRRLLPMLDGHAAAFHCYCRRLPFSLITFWLRYRRHFTLSLAVSRRCRCCHCWYYIIAIAADVDYH